MSRKLSHGATKTPTPTRPQGRGWRAQSRSLIARPRRPALERPLIIQSPAYLSTPSHAGPAACRPLLEVLFTVNPRVKTPQHCATPICLAPIPKTVDVGSRALPCDPNLVRSAGAACKPDRGQLRKGIASPLRVAIVVEHALSPWAGRAPAPRPECGPQPRLDREPETS